jgi:shikimate dehydrogenase
MQRYAVLGQPIAHSLSPRIHVAFGQQFGIAIDYRAIESGIEGFAAALEVFAREGGVGANVTLPLKQVAFSLCVETSARARACGSVNTLVRAGSAWRGDSTDGIGLLRDLLQHHAFDPAGSDVLLLGTGGASRAVAVALAAAGVRRLTIANRTRERADALARLLDTGIVRVCDWDRLDRLEAFQLVINATSAGHDGTDAGLPRARVAPGTLCYDLSYGVAARPFLAWAAVAGAARSSDGLGMLVEQAAEAFALWHGHRPETAPALAALRGGP